MTSSVGARRFWKARRIECCLASSREKTVICCGSPISPVSRRRTRTLPKEPVPPVTSTFLSLSINPPNFVVGRCVIVHPLDHLGPRRSLKPCRRVKARAIQAAVADKCLIWLDINRKSVSLLYKCKKVKFADGLG